MRDLFQKVDRKARKTDTTQEMISKMHEEGRGRTSTTKKKEETTED
jgi:hypothetical protein